MNVTFQTRADIDAFLAIGGNSVRVLTEKFDDTDHYSEDALQYAQELVAKAATNGNGHVPQPVADPLPDVPSTMKAKRQWVRWRLELVSGKFTKVPYQVNGQKASSSDPNTWTDYHTAVSGATINHEQGVGFMFSDGIMGIDLDGCRDPKTGEVQPWAEKIVDSLPDAYVEVSPSGTGLHAFVLGTTPGEDHKFNLNPAIGFGDKVAVEIYDNRRYFTVTGDAYFEEAGDVVACDLTAIYQKFHELRAANPVPKDARAESADVGESTQPTWHGSFKCPKYEIFKRGEIISQKPFVIDNRMGSLEYPSQSEADLAFCTVLAVMHDCNADKIWEEYVNSPLVRDKWLNREESFRSLTIATAIKTATKLKEKKTLDLTPQVPPTVAPSVPATPPNADVPAPSAAQQQANTAQAASSGATGTFPHVDEDTIPPFDDSVITGIFRDIVELSVGGTTAPRQFSFLIAKVYVCLKIAAGGMRFEGMDDQPNMYGAAIGPTGTSKGLSWNRTMGQVLLNPAIYTMNLPFKMVNSFDSGAGIRDLFLQGPIEMPVLGYIEEVRSLGNKASSLKNPEIVDAIGELANTHVVTRTKADDGGKKKCNRNDHAYLGLYICGQDGDTYMGALPQRGGLGLFDRLYPEYAEPIEAGDLPLIDEAAVRLLLGRLALMPVSGTMTMGTGVNDALKAFWLTLPKDIKTKVRYKSHLMLDMYLAAWSRGSAVAEMADFDVAVRIFQRQVCIRRVCFQGEVPDRVAYYFKKIKTIVERMRVQLNHGGKMKDVALAKRDIQRQAHAYDDNEVVPFNTAWRNFAEDHLATYNITAKNGQTYQKWVPMPYEDESWE